MSNICPSYAHDMPNINPRYAKNVPEIRNEICQKMPDFQTKAFTTPNFTEFQQFGDKNTRK